LKLNAKNDWITEAVRNVFSNSELRALDEMKSINETGNYIIGKIDPNNQQVNVRVVINYLKNCYVIISSLLSNAELDFSVSSSTLQATLHGFFYNFVHTEASMQLQLTLQVRWSLKKHKQVCLLW